MKKLIVYFLLAPFVFQVLNFKSQTFLSVCRASGVLLDGSTGVANGYFTLSGNTLTITMHEKNVPGYGVTPERRISDKTSEELQSIFSAAKLAAEQNE
jgi:hypothetical protein